MALQTHNGSCHCGAVRFESDLDLHAGTIRCNCTYCAKVRAWFVFARGPESFRLMEGEAALTQYQWTPEGRDAPGLTYGFCGRCGVRVFAHGELAQLGGIFHAVPVNVLDDVSPETLAELPVGYIDNLHGHTDRPPAVTSYL